jgi:GNAT superfamily N-acetyltransferase
MFQEPCEPSIKQSEAVSEDLFFEERVAPRRAPRRNGRDKYAASPQAWALKSRALDGVKVDFDLITIDVHNAPTRVVDITHVFVPEAMRGQGIAERAVLHLIKLVELGRFPGYEKLLATCSYVSETFLAKHAELRLIFVERPMP